MTIGMIWAQGHDGVIGSGGTMPWHVPEDLKHFRITTSGTAVIHGRASFEALPDQVRPLPNRRNIVLTSRADYDARGAEVAPSLPAALALVAGADVWICGGGQVYAEAMPHSDRVVVTDLDLRVDGDTWAPQIGGEWELCWRSDWLISRTEVAYRFSEYRRR